MPATLEARPRERAIALGAVVLIQAALGVALLFGLRVDASRPGEAGQRLIAIVLDKPPPLPPPPQHERRAAGVSRPQPAPSGSQPAPKLMPAQGFPTPVIAIKPTASLSGAGSGTGAGPGSGSGGASGSGGGGGTDLVQIAGAITQSDYPRDLRERGFGGRVEFTFTVGPSGRVTRCSVTRSSGVPRLDALTCALVQQRFVYRPSTDRFGRPIEDEVDGEQDWIAR